MYVCVSKISHAHTHSLGFGRASQRPSSIPPLVIGVERPYILRAFIFHVCVCVCVCVYMYVCACVCVCVCLSVFECVFV